MPSRGSEPDPSTGGFMPTIWNMFPALPERTRLFRRFRTHQDWTDRFMASPTLLGVVDAYGIELIHPIREGRRPGQIGKKESPTTDGSSEESSAWS